jgi:hypothetical protein
VSALGGPADVAAVAQQLGPKVMPALQQAAAAASLLVS